MYEDGAPHLADGFLEAAEAAKIPILGVCYGFQELVSGAVARPGALATAVTGAAGLGTCDWGPVATSAAAACCPCNSLHLQLLPSALRRGRPWVLASQVHRMGGKVEAAPKREFGHADLQIKHAVAEGAGHASLFEGLGETSPVWMSHGDKIVALPEGFVTTGERARGRGTSQACHHMAPRSRIRDPP